MSVVLSLTATGFAVDSAPMPTPNRVARSTPSATPTPGDPAVTVHAVSAVDVFNGLDMTTGELVRVHVTGIRSTAPCWADDALAIARKTLEGKKVWLLKDDNGARDPAGRLLAKVLLPSGQDYAEVVVAAGAGLADTGSDEQLTAAEAEARQHHRGVWASTCVPSTPSASESSEPPPSSTTETTTESGTTTVRPTTPVVVPPQPTVTTSPEPRPPDDVQRGVEMGARCSPQGARGVTAKGQDVRCMRKGEDLRWIMV